MKRFGFAIRTGGDPEIAGGLTQGIDAGTRLAIKMRSSEAVRRVAMRRHTPEELEAMIVQAQFDYGQDPEPSKLATAFLLAYAMICYGVSRLYSMQDRLLERRNDP